MTLTEFTRDIVPILALGVNCIALTSLFLLWWQVRQTAKWNRLQSQQAFLSRSAKELERENISAAREAGVELQARLEPLTSDEVNKIWSHPGAHHALMALLNDFEMTYLGIQAGAIDEEVVYNAHVNRITRGYYVYEPFVRRIRTHHQADRAFCEWEKVAARWKVRRDRQQRSLRDASGVSRRV